MDKKASMTGPEHFLTGEYKLQQASHLDPQMGEGDARLHAAQVAEAQAHFAAASASVMALMAAEADDDTVAGEWAALLGIEPTDTEPDAEADAEAVPE